MNLDPSGLENSDDMIIWSDDYAQNLVQTRSYRCAFCKRGFSNAQALGGHMNIHRKDRAKLKEFSDENLLSLDIAKSCTTTTDCTEKSSLENENQSSDDHKADDDIVPDDHEITEALIPLFDEAPSLMKSGCDREKKASPSVSDFDKQMLEKQVELSYGDELDLELRLGPEPHSEKSKPA